MQHAPLPITTINGSIMRKKPNSNANNHYQYDARLGHDEKMRLVTEANSNYAPSAETAILNQYTHSKEQTAIQNNVRA